MGMKKKMGLGSCILVIIGACVGSAIFSISGMTVYLAGGSAVLSWVIAALLYCAYGILLSELAVRYPSSGGIYIFPKRAFGGRRGSFWGFVSAWGYIISNIIAIGFSAIYAGTYFSAGFPGIASSRIFSIAAVIIAPLIIFSGKKRSQIIQNLLIILLIATMLIYCGSAIFGGHFQSSHFDNFFNAGVGGKGGFLSAVPLAMVAYGGCVAVSFMTSEVRNPSRNVSLSLFLGLGITAVLYILIIISIIGTLPISVLKEDSEMRFIPIFASISVGYLSDSLWLSVLVSVCATIALVTTIIILLRVNARAIQAMSIEAFFPKVFYKEDKNGTPVAAIAIMGAMALFLCFFPEWTSHMITLGAVLNILSMSITCISLIRSRKEGNGTGSSFRAPLGTALPVGVICVFAICYMPDIISGGGKMWLFTAAVYLLGMVFYLAGNRRSEQRISGTIVKGNGRGHTVGMPTANLAVFPGEKIPVSGVWETEVFLDGKIYRGVTNVGPRPSVEDTGVSTVETYILNFDGTVYDKHMTLHFKRFIRETKTFANLDEVKKQVEIDISSID